MSDKHPTWPPCHAFATPCVRHREPSAGCTTRSCEAWACATTQYCLLCVLARSGQVRQGDLSGLTSLDETTLTRNLAGWWTLAGSPSAAGTTAARSWSRSRRPGPPSWRRPAPHGSGHRRGCRSYYRRKRGNACWRPPGSREADGAGIDFFCPDRCIYIGLPRPKAGG